MDITTRPNHLKRLASIYNSSYDLKTRTLYSGESSTLFHYDQRSPPGDHLSSGWWSDTLVDSTFKIILKAKGYLWETHILKRGYWPLSGQYRGRRENYEKPAHRCKKDCHLVCSQWIFLSGHLAMSGDFHALGNTIGIWWAQTRGAANILQGIWWPHDKESPGLWEPQGWELWCRAGSFCVTHWGVGVPLSVMMALS